MQDVLEVDAIGNYSTDAASYYNGIDATSGKELAAQLHDLITSTHRYYTSYADNGRNAYQQHTDQYYEGDAPVNGYIYEFYSGVKWPNAWAPTAGNTSGGYNREHCWCQSNSVNAAGTQMWGESGGGADMHHLRPVEVRLNSTRNNHPYGEISNRENYKVYAKYGSDSTYALGGYYYDDTFEPLDSKKGDVARIILYTYLHYNSYTNTSLFGDFGTTNGNGSSDYFTSSLLSLTKTTDKNTEEDALDMLLQWNASDPVDASEQRRNEQVAIYQGNRNPFIDNSAYADLIWGDETPSPEPTVHSVSVSPSELELDLNGGTTGNLTATVTVSNGAATTVNWTSSNTNVATVSSSGVVTAVAKGSCEITATSTANPAKSASCSVRVIDTSAGSFTWDLSIASYDANPTEDLVQWSSEYATMRSIRTDNKNTKANNYLGGDAGNRTSSRFYANNRLTITPRENVTISSVEFTATTDGYATALGNSDWANATASSLNKSVRVTPTDGSTSFSAVIGGTCGFTLVRLECSDTSGPASPALDRIELNTSNAQTEFYVNDDFDYSGITVTAFYEDGTEDSVVPTSISSPDMSSAGNKTITVTYTEGNVTKEATYSINVLLRTISAYVSKTFHPGDVITASDITVEDNFDNEIDDFEFANDGYRFTYADAPSGGEEGTKTFFNAISAVSLTADLTVSVSRYGFTLAVTYTDTLDRALTGITGTVYKSWYDKTSSSGAIYAGQSAGGNDSIQLRSDNKNSGIITTAYEGSQSVTSISVDWNTHTSADRVLNIYGSNESYTSPADLYSSDSWGTLLGTIVYGSSTSLGITGSYKYIGIRSRSGALYLNSIFITYQSQNEETPQNLANYIMYEDTEGQCNTKFSTAKESFEHLSSDDRATFMTSNDYVLSCARERLQAWATYLGKNISYQNGDYVISSSKLSRPAVESSNENSTLLMLVLSSAAALVLGGGALMLRKRKEDE